MLFIDRYSGQSVTIISPTGEELTIEIIGNPSETGKVRLGFHGSHYFKILRSKSYEKKLAENISNESKKFPSDC